jgi:low affinity Fe/Cu permease
MIEKRFAPFSAWVADHAGGHGAFMLALASVLVWAAFGPPTRYSDAWMLVINTSTTIVTFLMVFVIQSSQNRDTRAIQVKLDELIRATEGASNRLIDLEHLTPSEIAEMQKRYLELAEKARKIGLEFDVGTPTIVHPDPLPEAIPQFGVEAVPVFVFEMENPMTDTSELVTARRVLVVEDEFLIAQMVKDMLAELECECVGPILTMEEGIAAAASVACEAAIINLVIQGQMAYPIVEELSTRGIPFCFASGAPPHGLEERWRSSPFIRKPYLIHELREFLLQLPAGPPTGSVQPAGRDSPPS